MPLLPELPPPVAHRTLEQRVAHKRAREALHRRLDMLEADIERIQQAVRQIERAIPWLAPRDRGLDYDVKSGSQPSWYCVRFGGGNFAYASRKSVVSSVTAAPCFCAVASAR